MRLGADTSIAGRFAARLHRSLGGTLPRSWTSTDAAIRLSGSPAGVPTRAPEHSAAPTDISIIGLDGDELSANRRAWNDSGLAAVSEPVNSDHPGVALVPSAPHASVLAGSLALTIAYACDLATSTGSRRPRVVQIDAVALLRSFLQHPFGITQLPGIDARSGRIELVGDGVFDCTDGQIYIHPVEDRQWLALLHEITNGEPPGTSDVASHSTWMREHPDELDALVIAWAAGRTATDAGATLRAHRIPVGIVNAPETVPQREPSLTRGFDPEHRRFAPWRHENIRTTHDRPTVTPVRRLDLEPKGARPLDGLRVLDLTWAWAGPFATSLLAELGAEVINLESWPRQSNLRVQPPFVSAHPTDASAWWSANQRGKYSIGIDLKHPAGRALAFELAEQSHVVVENFAPGVVDRLGIGYRDVAAHNEGIGYVSMSAFGQGPPADNWIGYGTQLWFESGLARTCLSTSVDLFQLGIPYPDPVSGVFGALAALHVVRRGGGYLDLSELEATALLAASAHGEDHGRLREDTDMGATRTLSDILEQEGDGWPHDASPEFNGSGVRLTPSPITIDGRQLTARIGAPRLFEHTEQVITQILGRDNLALQALREDGAIHVPDDNNHTQGATP